MAIQKWVGIVKMILPEKHKPGADEVIFVDVSKSKYLVPLNTDSTENDIVTNRFYLAQLLQQVSAHKNQVKYILCDVHFDIATKDDRLLIASARPVGNKFLCINSYRNNRLQKNILQLPSATATIDLQSGSVYKIPFFGRFNDTMVPYKVYYDLYHYATTTNFLATWFRGKGLSFNSQINDYYLRNKDFEEDGGYIKIGLGELVSLLRVNPGIFDQYLRNRFVLIGDFENDVHDTYLNEQAGTLILYNAYLHLQKNKELLSAWYLFVLCLFLYVIVWLQTSKTKHIYTLRVKLKFFESVTIPVNIISISILLVLFTFISSLVFGVNISIFHLILVFSVIDVVKFAVGKLEKKPG